MKRGMTEEIQISDIDEVMFALCKLCVKSVHPRGMAVNQKIVAQSL